MDAERPGWLGPSRPGVALPLPEPSFSSRLRWEINAAAPTAGPPPATLVGWLPTVLLAGAFAVTQLVMHPPEDSRWTDRNGFDSAIRRGLRGGSRDTRDAADVASDVLFGALGAGLAFDWWWLRDEYGLARSIQVDTRWFLATNVLTRVAKVSVGRQRPYVQPCGVDPNYVSSCGSGRDGNASFFSGHTSNSSALAGLLCARRLHRRERSVYDALLCGGAVAGAMTSGILRIVGEKHFATDVIAGWVVGGLVGYYLPSRLDYPGDPRDGLALTHVAPIVGRDHYGIQLGFRF
jgi:membrane-associated phospholipid phosphatase